MGRAEKRMAKKRSKKGQQYTGGRPVAMPSGERPRGSDVVSKEELLRRMGEVPVFGIKSGSEFVKADGGCTYFFDVKAAEMACLKQTGAAQVEGIPLSECYFESGTRLRPAQTALTELATIPESRRLVPDIAVPLFCIDGLQTTDKTTGKESLPMFNSKAELMEFAIPVYGAAAEGKVLATDLSVVVTNMIRGPAGPLRRARFFSDATGLTWMDQQAATLAKKTAMFPTELGEQLDVPMDVMPASGRGKGPAMPEMPNVFGGLKNLFP